MGAVGLTARSEMRRRWAALLLLGLLVGLAGAAVYATAAAAIRSRSAYDRFVAQAPQPNIDVELAEPGTAELVERVARMPGVDGASLGSFVAVLPEGQGVPFVDGIAFARVASAELQVNGDVRVSGRDLDARRPNEVVLNPAMADELDAGPGDVITLDSLRPETAAAMFEGADVSAPDGPRIPVRVTGVRRIAEDISDAPDPILIVSPALLERDDVFGFAGLLAVRAEPGRVDEVAEALSHDLEGATVTPSADFRPRIQRSLDVQAATLVAVCIAAAVAGIGGVAQAVVRHVQGSRADDGVRAVLGMTRSQRAAAALLGVLPVVVVAALVTVVLGSLGAPLAVTGLAALAEPDPGAWLDLPVAALTVLGVAGVVMLAALATPVAGTSRQVSTAPVEPLGMPLAAGMGVRRALGGGAAGWAGRSALGASVLAVATIAAVTTFQTSIDALLTEPERWAADFDAAAIVGTDDEAVSRFATEHRDDPRIDAVAEGRRREIVVRRPGGPIRAGEAVSTRPAVGQIRPWVSPSGVLPNGRREVLVGRDVLDRVGVDVGDELDITVSGTTSRVTVVGEAIAYGTDQMDEAVVVHPSITDQLGDGPDERYLMVRFADGVDHTRARADLASELGVDVEDVTPPSTVDRLRGIGALPFVLLTFVAVLGVLAVGHALVASVRRSRRELATLRALGMTGRQVGEIVLFQAITIAVVGLLLGVPVGVAVGRQAFGIVDRGIGALGDPVASFAGVAAAVVGSLLVAVLLARVATLRIRPFGWAPELRGD